MNLVPQGELVIHFAALRQRIKVCRYRERHGYLYENDYTLVYRQR